jgi:hypothetical protein
VLSQSILELAAPALITGIDPSAGYVAYAREHLQDARARFLIGDAQALADPEASYDVVVSALVLNFVLRPEELVAAYVWDYAGQMQLIRHFWNAAGALDPAARELDKGVRFSLCRPERLADLWRGAVLPRPRTVSDAEQPWQHNELAATTYGGRGHSQWGYPGRLRACRHSRRGSVRCFPAACAQLLRRCGA